MILGFCPCLISQAELHWETRQQDLSMGFTAQMHQLGEFSLQKELVFIDTSFSQDDGKGDRKEGTLTPASS